MSLGNDKTQTSILIAVFITAMLVMLTTPVIFAMAGENRDWPNALTLTVEVAVGVLIAIIVYIHSKAQHNTSQELSSRMTSILKELERSQMAERRLVSRTLVSRLKFVIQILKWVLRQNSKRDTADSQERKKILDQQRKKIKDLAHQSDLKIERHELARIFDEDIATQYRSIRAQIEVMPPPIPNNENYHNNYTHNIDCYEWCIDNCKDLIDKVNQHVQDRGTASNPD